MELPQDVNLLNIFAQKYLTPGGPDDIQANDQEDDKKQEPNDNLLQAPVLSRQITQYCFSKYQPSRLKELVATVFEEHFDKKNNNDVDIKEFKDTLKDLGANMTEHRMEKLFQLINGTNGDLSDLYIDKDNFCDFIGKQYYNQPTEQRYQEELLRVVSPKFDDNTPIELNKMLSLNTIVTETKAMKDQMKLLLNSGVHKMNQNLEFQGELSKRKTSKQNFCEELNAQNWDEYEVAYWVGVILGYDYCMKRFADEKIVGKMLLFDVDIKMLMNLTLNQIHLNTFQRRLASLRKIALKDMYEAERKKKIELEEKERELKEKERRSSVVLEFNTMNNIHIDSDTRYLEEEQKTEIQRIQLDATKNESKLMYEISELNKKITGLTSNKLELIEKVNGIKQGYEDKISLLKAEIEQGKLASGGHESLKQEINLLKKRNENVKAQNAKLNIKIKTLNDAKRNVDEDKPERIYKIKCQKLESELRTIKLKNEQLQKQNIKLKSLKSIGMEMIDDYDGEQEQKISSSAVISDDISHRKEPPSPIQQAIIPQKPKPKPNQFLMKVIDNDNEYAKSKKGSMDIDHEIMEEQGMQIYDSDNTPQ